MNSNSSPVKQAIGSDPTLSSSKRNRPQPATLHRKFFGKPKGSNQKSLNDDSNEDDGISFHDELESKDDAPPLIDENELDVIMKNYLDENEGAETKSEVGETAEVLMKRWNQIMNACYKERDIREAQELEESRARAEKRQQEKKKQQEKRLTRTQPFSKKEASAFEKSLGRW